MRLDPKARCYSNTGGRRYRADTVNGKRDTETWRTVLCSRKGFIDIGGYGKVFRDGAGTMKICTNA